MESNNELTVDQINQMQMTDEELKKAIWYVWFWKKGAIHKGHHQYEYIVVTKTWVENNKDNVFAEGEVVRGPFLTVTESISVANRLNEVEEKSNV
jgi:hypothetical protein